jgi:chromosome segregation ATPase
VCECGWIQDHLSDVSHRLARAEKQREEQRKEAGRAQGQMQVMRSRISELQARIDAEEEALARAVRTRDQKDGLARELRDRLSTQAQALDKALLQRDDLMKEAQELRAQVEDLQGEMQGREDSFREHVETLQRRNHSEKSMLERQLQAQEREHAARGGGTSSRGQSSTDVAVSRSPWRAERVLGSRRSRSESGSPEGRAHVVAGNGSMADRVVHELTDKLEDLALKYASLKELHRHADEALQRSRAECSRLVSESVTNRLASMHTSPAHAHQAHQPPVTAPAQESAPHHLARGHPSGDAVCDERTDAAAGSMHDSGDGERRAQAQAQALQDELADLKQVCARLQSELSAKSRRLEGLEEALACAGPAADAAYVRGLEDQLLSLKADMDKCQGEADKAAAEAREEVGRERERCNALKVEVALREEEMARRQSAWAAKTEQLAADLEACSTELEQCRAELVAERCTHSRDELKAVLEALRLEVQQSEADLASARDKAAEDAAAMRAACMEDMGKARLEAANRLSAEAEKYRGLLQDKEAELVAAK